MTNEPKTEQKQQTPKPSADWKSPDALLYADLYKNAMMGADSLAKIIGKAGNAQEKDGMQACAALREELTVMMEGYAKYAQDAAKALSDIGMPAEQLTALEKLPAEIGITMQTMFDKSVSKCAEIVINGITMGIIDMKKAMRACSEDGCSPAAYRMAEDLIGFCERYAERFGEFL